MAFTVTSFNRKRLFTFEPTHFEYFSLEELYGNDQNRIYTLRAIYISTKGLFGDQPVFAIDSGFVNIPQHLLEVAINMKEDEECVQAINAGKVGFEVVQYQSRKYGKLCYEVEMVDIS